MLNVQQLSQDVRQLVPKAQAAWLYGSQANGQTGQDSDVDVAILFDAKHPFDAWALSQTASQLASRWGKPVDLIDMRQAPCVLQNEIIHARHRLFACDAVQADTYELFALSQYRDHTQRYAATFAHIASSGKVLRATSQAVR